MRAQVVFGEKTEEYIKKNKNKLSNHFVIEGEQTYTSLHNLFKKNGESNRSFWVGNSLFEQYEQDNITLAELAAILQIYNAKVMITELDYVSNKLLKFIEFWKELGTELVIIEDDTLDWLNSTMVSTGQDWGL